MLLFIYLLFIHFFSAYGSLCITKIIVRVPKEKDIGLIFDITVSNSNKGPKRETYNFIVSSDGTCTLNTTKGDQVKNVGRIFGGDFGAVEPGKSETVSLVWPTVSLYNRVGNCPIIISTVNAQKDLTHTLQMLHFDTRFETLDPDRHSLRKHKDFMDCKNWDKDYFRNCTPLNCEERYFGQRSFYNYEAEQCEPVTPCSNPDEYYDIYANECVDKNSFITEDELEQIKDGKFDNNYLTLRGSIPSSKESQGPSSPAPKECPSKQKQCSSGRLSLLDFNTCFQHLEVGETDLDKPLIHFQPAKILQKKSIQGSLLTRFYYDWYLPYRAGNIDEDHNPEEMQKGVNDAALSGAKPTFPSIRQLDAYGWFELAAKGMLIILLVIIFQISLTCVTYVFVCIMIYGFLELVARLKKHEETADDLSKKLTPVDTESNYSIVTKESCMSQR